jgi:hypothetical protein
LGSELVLKYGFIDGILTSAKDLSKVFKEPEAQAVDKK